METASHHKIRWQGAWLCSLRKAAKLSKEQVAQRMDCDLSMVERVESGKATQELIEEYSAALRVNPPTPTGLHNPRAAGAAIAALCRLRGLEQQELAKAVGVSNGRLSSLLKGHARIHREMLGRLLEALQVDEAAWPGLLAHLSTL